MEARGRSSMPERFRYLTKEAPEKPVRWPWLIVLGFMLYAWRAVVWEFSKMYLKNRKMYLFCSVKLHPTSDDKIKKSVSNYATSNDDDVKVLSNADFLQGKPVALSFESRTNIVAYGTIVHVIAAEKLLHDVPLSMSCMHVSIDNAVDK